MTCSPLLYTRPGVFLRSSHGTDKRQPWKLLLFRNRSSIGVDRQKRAMATHVSFGKRLEIHFVGHVLRLASTLRVDKKERRARFLISPSSSLLQEVCSPQLTTAGSKRKKIRRRRRRHVRSISMQGRITDTKKQSRREREREAVRRQHRDNVSEYVHNQWIQYARTVGFANSCMCEISYD